MVACSARIQSRTLRLFESTSEGGGAQSRGGGGQQRGGVSGGSERWEVIDRSRMREGGCHANKERATHGSATATNKHRRNALPPVPSEHRRQCSTAESAVAVPSRCVGPQPMRFHCTVVSLVPPLLPPPRFRHLTCSDGLRLSKKRKKNPEITERCDVSQRDQTESKELRESREKGSERMAVRKAQCRNLQAHSSSTAGAGSWQSQRWRSRSSSRLAARDTMRQRLNGEQ